MVDHDSLRQLPTGQRHDDNNLDDDVDDLHDDPPIRPATGCVAVNLADAIAKYREIANRPTADIGVPPRPVFRGQNNEAPQVVLVRRHTQPTYTGTQGSGKVRVDRCTLVDPAARAIVGRETALEVASDRDGTVYPVVLPPKSSYVNNEVYWAAWVNGQLYAWEAWGECTTTSTTTRVCPTCDQIYPDMSVTVTGTAAGPNALCTDFTGTYDYFCRHHNRTWCLYFGGPGGIEILGGLQCAWASDQIYTGCTPYFGGFQGVGDNTIQARLAWPSELEWGGIGPPVVTDCAKASLLFEPVGVRYVCNSFNPNTGGTFHLQTPADGIGINDCRNWPASLTVSAQSGCTTTTSTTTTTTTTSTTSTSSTSAVPCGTCQWMWTGTVWILNGNFCTGGCSCVPPTTPGTALGELANTFCFGI